MKAVNALRYVVVMALVFTSSAALAIDAKVYPGNSCIATGDFAAEAEGYVNGLWNTGTHDLFVKCLVVRENITNTTGTESAKISVASNGTDLLQCGLWVHDHEGNFVANHFDSTTSATVTILDVDVNSSVANANYSISCNLPPGAWIYSYKIKEP
jgi:hypothetical protein